MDEAMEAQSPRHVAQSKQSRRGFLKRTSITALAATAGAGALVSNPDTIEAASYAVPVDFERWGYIYLAAGFQTTWWFTWNFSSNRWSRFDATPYPGYKDILIVRQWAESDTVRRVTFQNIGTSGTFFYPTVIVSRT
jgi:hypothetical protein